MPTRDEAAAAASDGWWWLNLETGAALQAKETSGPMLQLKAGQLMLIHLSGGELGRGMPRVICYGSLEELRGMVRGWLGDDLHVEERLLELRTGSFEEEPLLSRGPHGFVNAYWGPLSSPWAIPLPRTVAEARSFGERDPVGMEAPASIEAFLQYLVGVWVLCSNVDVPDALDGLGLVVDPDGRWAALLGTEAELRRSTGLGTEGDWVVRETRGRDGSPLFQLELLIDGDGILNALPTFATSPPLMHLEVPNSGPSATRNVGAVSLGPAQAGRDRLQRTHLQYVRLDQSLPRQTHGR
jgi:hypothetical protein